MQTIDRRTTTDQIFDYLHDEIVHMRFLPGTKLPEAEIARQFGVSRQPIRDAFNRLSNLELVCVRPQRATVVRGFSYAAITETRFIRMAVELEVVRRACEIWNDASDKVLQEQLNLQREAFTSGNDDEFYKLDTQFHQLICQHADCTQAIDTLLQCRQKVGRLCRLSTIKPGETEDLLQDHEDLAAALVKQSVDDAMAVTKRHLARLDVVIADIRENQGRYFEDLG